MKTIFQRTELTEPALFSPSDTTKRIKNFPEICVSTFSKNIIERFSSLNTVEKIAGLYTANSVTPIYKIRYKNTDIAFYPSRIGAPACVAMLAVSKYRQLPFIQFLYGADNLSSDTWEIRDLALHGLSSWEKYMVLSFECGLAL